MPLLPGRAGEWRNRQSGVAYRRLGRTNFMISEVVMGGNTIAPDNYEHVLHALDLGLNYPRHRSRLRTRQERGRLRARDASRPRDQFFLNSKVSLWDVNRGKLYRDIFNSLSDAEKAKLQTQVQEEIERSGAFAPDYVCDYFDGQRPELPEATLANLMEKRYGRQIDRDKNYKQIILDSVDESLKRIGTDHLDLLMCPHGASTGVRITQLPGDLRGVPDPEEGGQGALSGRFRAYRWRGHAARRGQSRPIFGGDGGVQHRESRLCGRRRWLRQRKRTWA